MSTVRKTDVHEKRAGILARISHYRNVEKKEARRFFLRGQIWHYLSLGFAVAAALLAAISAAKGLVSKEPEVAGWFALSAALASGVSGVGAGLDAPERAKRSFRLGADYEREKDHCDDVLATKSDAPLDELEKELNEIKRRFDAVRKREVAG
jgi:hypothetical protein